MPDADVELVRSAWSVWIRGDLDRLMDYYSSDIVWSTENVPEWPESDYRGPDGIRRFFDEWLEVWDGYEAELEEVMSLPDGRVLTYYRHRGRGRASGLVMDESWAQVFTIAQGKIARIDNYTSREEAREAAGLPD